MFRVYDNVRVSVNNYWYYVIQCDKNSIMKAPITHKISTMNHIAPDIRRMLCKMLLEYVNRVGCVKYRVH